MLRRWVAPVLVVAVSGVVLGGLTFEAQKVLPDSLAPLANSSSGWTLVTALVVAAVRPSLPVGAWCGLAGFVGLVLGYTVVAELSGLEYSPVLWGAVGVVAGPFVGAAAAALRDPRPVARAVGAALLAGVALTDTVYGLTVVADSTSPTYWIGVGVLGLLLLAVVGARLGSVLAVLTMLGVAIVLVALGTAAYAALFAGVAMG